MKDFLLIVLGSILTMLSGIIVNYLSEKKQKKKEFNLAFSLLLMEVQINILSFEEFINFELPKENFSMRNLIVKTTNWEKCNHILFENMDKDYFNIFSKWYLDIEKLSFQYSNKITNRHNIKKHIEELIKSGYIISNTYDILNIAELIKD